MISTCNELRTDKIVVIKENKRVFRIKNSSDFNINTVTVDGCYITTGLKCDFLFEIINNEEIEKVFYVELKGSDVAHGIQQLEATLRHCLSEHKSFSRECYIVASRVPKSSTSSQNQKKEFRRKNRVSLFIDTNQKEVVV